MITTYLVWFLLLVTSFVVPNQTPNRGMGFDPSLRVIDQFEEEHGFYVFAPGSTAGQRSEAVVFIHGYGALNPMIYGGWIRHLTDRGHVVIYPRYQKGLLGTSPDDFVRNTARAIADAITVAREKGITLSDELYLIGHSYGGVIAANIAVTWKDWEIPVPRIALLCEPGSGPLNGGVLDAYHGISDDIHLVIVVGDDDHTVGQKFGELVYETAKNTPGRALLWQYASEKDTCVVSASHYEPYSIDPGFDNGIENLSTKRAMRLARTDWIDRQGYWKIFDMLVAREQSAVRGAYTTRELDAFADLGVWPDNTPLRKMDYRLPQDAPAK